MGTQGVTHYGWEDMAVMRSLPGMTVMDPADHVELYHCLEKALDMNAARLHSPERRDSQPRLSQRLRT